MAYFRKKKGESEEAFKARIAFVTEEDKGHENVPHIHVKDAEIKSEAAPLPDATPPKRVDSADKAEVVIAPVYRPASIQRLKNGTVIVNA